MLLILMIVLVVFFISYVRLKIEQCPPSFQGWLIFLLHFIAVLLISFMWFNVISNPNGNDLLFGIGLILTIYFSALASKDITQRVIFPCIAFNKTNRSLQARVRSGVLLIVYLCGLITILVQGNQIFNASLLLLPLFKILVPLLAYALCTYICLIPNIYQIIIYELRYYRRSKEN